MEHYAFYNFFQRPADKTGDSIKVTDQDVVESCDVLSEVLKILSPDLVLFISSLAGEYGKTIVRDHEIENAITPHPTCKWWNKYAKKYKGLGKEIVPRFINSQNWLKI